MRLDRSRMTPTEDPSIFSYGGKLYHIPRSFRWKLAYLLFGFVVLAAGLWFGWDPAFAALFGRTVEGRITRVVKSVPGSEPQVIRYRREFVPERDRSITFQHYVEVQDNGVPRILRLGVDSRVVPYANVNDRTTVCYAPGKHYAFQKWEIRTWGVAILYTVVGLSFVAMGVPMLAAVGKPIEIDPEAPVPENSSSPK